MPNLIRNALTVCGEPGAVDAFVKAARGRKPPTGDPRPPGKSKAVILVNPAPAR